MLPPVRVLSLALALGLPAAAPAFADPLLDGADALVAEVVGDGTPGLGVLVLRKGEVLHMAGYGLADLEDETPVTPDSIFDLASVSKQMTALAARMQIDEGLYAEETPVADLLPAFAAIDSPRPITVGDLIHHLSGLTDYLSWEDYAAETTNDEVVDWLANQSLDHDPGTRFDYSNSGYLTLGSVIAAAEEAGALHEVLQARVWDVAGMAGTALPGPIDPERRVSGYAGTGGDFSESHDPNIVEGDGNVFSTLRDLAKYEAAFWDGSLLDDPATLYANGALDDGSPIADENGEGYAYGWSVSDGYATHSGSWMGTATVYVRNLQSGVTVILLANGEDASLWPLATALEELAEAG
jgi:CubicO group peptidase (beta-lactamase class C family)